MGLGEPARDGQATSACEALLQLAPVLLHCMMT